MLFNVNLDNPELVLGYLVPDTFNGQCEVVITRGDREIFRKLADEPRDELRMSGRHATGRCGFTITPHDVPDLGSLPDFEIWEPESGLMIHRRCALDTVVPQKILRLETQLLPLVRLDRALQPRFRLHYPLMDRFGLETLSQVFLVSGDSIYVSGRIAFRSIEQHVDSGFKVITILQEPFEEMAERILVMRAMANGYRSYLGSRDALLYEEAIAFAAELPIDNERELQRAFRSVSPEAEAVLADPLMRQLTTRQPNEPIQPSAISGALHTMSSFAAVGLRHHGQLFVDDVAQVLSIDPAELPAIDQIPATKALAERLRACPTAEVLLENDLALYDYVRDAFEKPVTRE